MMNNNDIKNLIRSIGFKPTEGKQGLFYKNYPAFNYHIEIDMNRRLIIYPAPIIVSNQTTSNFTSDENFVVLECVDRLIKKGYAPSKIELERNFKLGHKNSGRLDITIYNDEDTDSFLMIECKTFGQEFDKEIVKMHKDGGQLFSYYQQDKNTKLLCLYTSRIFDGEWECTSKIIECNAVLSKANNVKDMFQIWNKQFKDKGLFEDDASAYNFKPNAIKLGDLKQLRQEDSSKIFNGFMEILRHNVISDKPNAFNKIFNLFLCKLQDERGLEENEAQLQWLESDDPVKFLMRINELYAEGVKNYLGKEIANLTEKRIDEMVNKLSNENNAKEITEAILYKNNEFAFSDVYDKISFTQNAEIVREIVELLQPYKICYAHKQQFLGDFFELLLNTGFKQETGQFFTPVPLARFIINSLPIKQIIKGKLDGKSPKFLPYVIDYAMGTGHFITEAMDEIQLIINSQELVAKDKDSQSKISIYSGKDSQFDWAKEYIYGIERDYRLVKTAKVSCFLHGDGEANIIHGDGLGNFKTSRDYKDKDLLKSNSDNKDNQKFDILVANPPYSVSAFKRTLPHGEDSFELYNHLTDQSSEIECLFIERAKQLVKKGGYAAIILPSSILSNGGIYSKAREILLKYFEIYAIAEFGANTFMATGTNTIVLFMMRRDDKIYSNIKKRVSKFMNDFQDVTSNELENAFSNYAKFVYGIEFDDYVTLLQGNEIEHDIFNDYKQIPRADSLKKIIQKKETEKLIFYILNVHVKTVLIKSGERKIEKEFLGYEFSNRRGHEGIKIHKNADGSHANKLYNADRRDDPERVSHYIYQNGLIDENGLRKPPLDIPESLNDHLSYTKLCDLIKFDKADCEKKIFLTVEETFEPRKSKYNIKLEDLLNNGRVFAHKGNSITSSKANSDGDIPVIAGGITSPYNHDKSNVDVPCFTISASGTAGHVWFHDKPIWASDCTYFYSTDEKNISTKYLYELFKFDEDRIKKTATGIGPPHVYLKDLLKLLLPIPPIEIQNDIIKRIEAISSNITKYSIGTDAHAKAVKIDVERQKRAIMSELWED